MAPKKVDARLMAMVAERKIVGAEDMLLLSKVTNEGIVENLKKRFQSDEIYTSIMDVLIVVNPFKWLHIYDADHVKMYEGAARSDVPPHIYMVASEAFSQMIQEEDPQCVIISGESGAGKTEAAKGVLGFIAAASGSGGHDAAVTKLKDIIMESNPVLEGFGNAMTLRNNNSSRFGKYFRLRFDLANGGTPRGGLISNYLLEKSRVVMPGKGERSYHVFYQLLAGADASLKRDLQLGPPESFGMLRVSGVTSINNEGGSVDDAKEFAEVVQSMQVVGMSPQLQRDFFRIVGTVLHLSNVDFMPQDVNGAEGSRVKDARSLQTAAQLLAVDSGALQYAFEYRTLTTMAPGGGVETYQVPQNPVQARASRDALAKDLYSRLFDLLVAIVNDALLATGASSRRSVREAARGIDDVVNDSLTIGVLDIFGFEIFNKNGFEQLCINYVNEKLQQLFISLTIRNEQDTYAAEGIAWTPIPFFDNLTVIELIEAKNPPGVLAVLDDTCRTVHSKSGNEVDVIFLDKVTGVCSKHKHFRATRAAFTILHYAGEVEYSVDGFIDANKDTLGQDLLFLAKSSKFDLMQRLYPEEVDVDNRKAPPTAGFKIKQSMGELMLALMSCAPHYVRCIKSNDRKKAGIFDDQRVLHQVQYLGLLENLKVRRAGFSYRVEFFKFVQRFKVIGAGVMDNRVLTHGSDRDVCEALMVACKKRVAVLNQPGEMQMGRTMLFLKSPETYFELLEVRKDMVSHQAVKIQTAFRRYMARRDLVNMRQEMADLWQENGKEATPADLLRPYRGLYLEEDAMKLQLAEILDFYQSSEDNAERLQYSEVCTRLDGDCKREKIVLAVTDNAIYVCEWRADPIDPKMLALAKKNKQKPPEATYTLFLLRRTELKDVEAIQVTKLADDFLMIMCRPQEKLKHPNKENWVPASSVKRCMETQEPFSFFGKSRHQCAWTGGVYVKEVMVSIPALPDKGWYSKVEVHKSVEGFVSIEAREDLVLETPAKAELAAALRDLVTRAKGGGPSPMPTSPMVKVQADAGAVPMAKALYDYSPAQPDELALRVGDMIELLDTSSSPDWWAGALRGKTGLFPAAYVEKIVRGGPVKPKRVNPARGFAVPILFNDVLQVRGCGYGRGLANNPNCSMEFARDPTINEVQMKAKGGKLFITVPPGVAGQKVREIQQAQAERAARQAALRDQEYEQRRINAAKREAERATAREQKLAEKKAKKQAERDKLDKATRNLAGEAVAGTGASFAARMAGSGAAAGAGGGGAVRNNAGAGGFAQAAASAMAARQPASNNSTPQSSVSSGGGGFAAARAAVAQQSGASFKQPAAGGAGMGGGARPTQGGGGGGGNGGGGGFAAARALVAQQQGATTMGGARQQMKQSAVPAEQRTDEWRKEIKSLTQNKTTVPAPSPPKPQKVSQWEAYTDDDSGETYYYNKVSGESTWTKPTGFTG